MSRLQTWLALAALALVALVALMPLSVALAMGSASDLGLAARRVEGSVWAGRLRDATIGGVPVGDVRVGLLPIPLLLGRRDIAFAAPALRGTIQLGAVRGMADTSGTLDPGSAFAPLPPALIDLDMVSVQFAQGRCTRAEGRVRMSFSGSIGGLALPGGMSGLARCASGALALPLVGQSGMEKLLLTIAGDGQWQGRITIRTSDPAQAARLLGAGFATGPGGYRLTVAGRL